FRGGGVGERGDGRGELRVWAVIVPQLHVVVRDGAVAPAVQLDRARVLLVVLLLVRQVPGGLAVGHVLHDGLAELAAVALARASGLVLALGDLDLGDLGTRVVRAGGLGLGTALDPAGLGRGRVETAG